MRLDGSATTSNSSNPPTNEQKQNTPKKTKTKRTKRKRNHNKELTLAMDYPLASKTRSRRPKTTYRKTDSATKISQTEPL